MPPSVALLGGTGRLGPGLALRFARRGVRVRIGSRDPVRGAEAAAAVRARLTDLGEEGAAEVTGHANIDAARASEISFLTVPFEGVTALLRECGEALAGRVVVSAVVPLTVTRELGPQGLDVPEGSAAEQAAALVPGARLVAGFHSLSNAVLDDPGRGVDAHVVVTGDDVEAKRIVMELAELLDGVRAVDGGGLRYARQSEQLTVLLVSINRVYRCHAGVVITDLPHG